MKLCNTCNELFEDDKELCPVDSVRLADAGKSPFIGKYIDDRYRILAFLGQGSMGAVFRALDETTSRQMAIKLLHGSRVSDPNSRRRFLREAKTISSLNHPNIVKLFHYGLLGEEQPYIVTEFLKGESLARRIREKGHIPIEEALPIMRQVLSAVAEAHRAKVIHRDLKPENIVLENDVVKVLDFGVAKLMFERNEQSGSLTMDGKVCGSPGYMSPEQCRGEELDIRSDVYSLGVTIFEMLTGKRPFYADDVMGLMFMHVNRPPPSLNAIRVDLPFPTGLETAVRKALSKTKFERQSSAEELLDDIELSLSKFEKKKEAGAQMSSGWIPFDESSVKAVNMALKDSQFAITTPQEVLPAAGILTHDEIAQSGKTHGKKNILSAGAKHRFNVFVFTLVSAFLMFSALKLVFPEQPSPQLPDVEQLISQGRNVEALQLLDKIKRQKLKPHEQSYVDDMLFNLGIRLAQAKDYQRAADSLLRVSKNSDHFSKAANLGKRYRKLGSDN
ncbi:MAG: serine/threonine protein kinase [Candidatus Melainabacteria bacterium]|jgi:serine/threonine-protein kinase|nr:serine/threonine protein kinase [Candidatus Melainabacteria bacterium]